MFALHRSFAMNPILNLYRFTPKSIPLLISYLLCLGVFAYTLFIFLNPKEETAKEFISKRYGTFLASPAGQASIKVAPSKDDEAGKLISQIYSSREEAYHSTSEKLSNVLFSLVVLTVVGIFILFFKPELLEIPVIKLALPDKLFFIIIPIVIVYFWIRLGLLMNASIDSRLVLESMTDTIETIGPHRVSYYHSNSRTLVDQGFVDTWCTYYYDVFDGGANKDRHFENARIVLFGFFGTFWGLTLATCFCLVTTFYEIHRNALLSILLISFSGFMLAGWTINMIAWYPHFAGLAVWTWGVALIAVLLWNIFGRKYAEQMARERRENEARIF